MSGKDIAIVGMSCIFPGSPSVDAFWQNIVNNADCLQDAGPKEWDADFYKNKHSDSFGGIYCSRGGFITDYAEFDPLEFGIMPASLNGSDPDQFLALRAAAEALSDAGYHHKAFDGAKAEIVIGRTMAPGIGSLNLIQHGQTVDQVIELLKTIAPQLDSDELKLVESKLRSSLNPCNADTIPAVMPNILSGRIASKLGFRGRNLILDAACASSLVAVETAMQSLHSGQADIAIAGGVHINSSPYFYQMFCELGALSRSGRISPFDESADGTVLGEGVGMVVLKRLEDARKDGNKIYALIRGIGTSSDGRGGGSLAPSVEGEALAMQRAYEMAGVSPRTVEYLEAHGTGTPVGDRVEMQAIKQVFSNQANDHNSQKPWCAISSVKTMIGHTQAASGIAGLIKATLALHNKLIPQTQNVSKPNKDIDWQSSPCYLNKKAKIWKENETCAEKEPRRAAVSAFGFGGVNAHVVLEEYREPEAAETAAAIMPKPSETTQASTTQKASKSRLHKLALSYPAIKGKDLGAITFKTHKPPLMTEHRPPHMPEHNPPEISRHNPPVLPSRAPEAPPSQTHQAQSSQNRQPLSPQNAPAIPAHKRAVPPAQHANAIEQDEQALVLKSYIDNMSSFQKNLLAMQENVMLQFLSDESEK